LFRACGPGRQLHQQIVLAAASPGPDGIRPFELGCWRDYGRAQALDTRRHN
jgi:hypothetical protein